MDLKDPLVRRFISACCFASAFIWVAVYFFDVELQVVRVLFVFSVIFVIGLIFGGLLLAPLIRMFRSEPALLSKLQKREKTIRSREGE